MRSILLFFLLALPAFAGEDAADNELALPESIAGPSFADVFDASRAVRPRPGDWLEYRIAYPVDPLENSLDANPAPVPGAPPPASPPPPDPGETIPTPGDTVPELLALQPIFDPPTAWRTLPLRLHIREVDENGCNAEMLFGGKSVSLRLSSAREEAHGSFHYNAGTETERRMRINGTDHAVREIRRSGADYGFVRWFSEEIPFGTVRFATADVDLLLVGFGRGVAPDFPLRPADEADPAAGNLY